MTPEDEGKQTVPLAVFLDEKALHKAAKERLAEIENDDYVAVAHAAREAGISVERLLSSAEAALADREEAAPIVEATLPNDAVRAAIEELRRESRAEIDAIRTERQLEVEEQVHDQSNALVADFFEQHPELAPDASGKPHPLAKLVGYVMQQEDLPPDEAYERVIDSYGIPDGDDEEPENEPRGTRVVKKEAASLERGTRSVPASAEKPRPRGWKETTRAAMERFREVSGQ